MQFWAGLLFYCPLLVLLLDLSGVCVTLCIGSLVSSVSPLGLVLHTAKFMVARSCASFPVVTFALLGLLQSHGPAVLLGQFCCTVILVRERGGQLCWDMILERKGPGSLPLSGVPDGCQLARVDLELLGLEPGFFRLIRLEGQLVRRMKGFLVG